MIADTAGRLHNKDNLMQELKKLLKLSRKLMKQRHMRLCSLLMQQPEAML